jgi:hypothetical protein
VKVTVTPLSGLPKESVTNTWSGTGNGPKTVTLCGVPATVWIAAAAPVEIVKELLSADTSKVPRAVN